MKLTNHLIDDNDALLTVVTVTEFARADNQLTGCVRTMIVPS